MAEPVEARYREGGDNRYLRSGLVHVHSYRCYWCREPKPFGDLEIDHVLPRTASPAEIAALKSELGVVAPFDVDDPYNLMPICGSCNGSKTNTDYTTANRVLTDLRKARGGRSRVVSWVRDLLASGEFADLLLKFEGILKAAPAPTVTTDLRKLAPAFVQHIASIDAGLVQYGLQRRVVPPPSADPHPFDALTVTLDTEDPARRAVDALDMLGKPIDDWVASLPRVASSELDDLCQTFKGVAEGANKRDADSLGRVGELSINLEPEPLALTIWWAEAKLTDGRLQAEIQGELSVGFSGVGVIPSYDGDGLDEFQGYALCTTTVKVTLAAEPEGIECTSPLEWGTIQCESNRGTAQYTRTGFPLFDVGSDPNAWW